MTNFFNKLFGGRESEEGHKEVPTLTADEVKKFLSLPEGFPSRVDVGGRLFEDEEFTAWRAKNGLELDTGRKKVVYEGRELWFETLKDHYGSMSEI